MDSDFVRKQININKRVGELERIELYQATVSKFQMIPGLMGFWPTSSVQRSTGNVYDLSGQGRTLTYNGSASFNVYNNVVPYINFDGASTTYLSRNSETDLNITGKETINACAVRGLTVGGWFLTASNPRLLQGLVTKDDLSGSRSYSLYLSSTTIGFLSSCTVSSSTIGVTYSGVPDNNTWYFLVGRLNPSTKMSLFSNGIEIAQRTSSIPASIISACSSFCVGSFNAGTYPLLGYSSFVFLSHQAVSDTFIGGLFNYSRILFNI